METAWIQVFVLTLSECFAPAGKVVCQEQELDLQFLTQADCEVALEQLLSLKDESERIIVYRNKSGCAPSAREQAAYASAEEVRETLGSKQDWQAPRIDQSRPDTLRLPHEKRLATLPTCEESEGVAPCRVDEIIIEGTSGDPVEVWRRVD